MGYCTETQNSLSFENLETDFLPNILILIIRTNIKSHV